MTTARFVWMFALLAAATLVAAGFGARFGVWDFRLGLQLVRWSEYTGLAAVGLALIALVIPRWRRGRVALLVAALVVGACVAYVPWQWFQSARSVPPINDITTDTENPPAFVALVPARAGLSVPTVYPGSATCRPAKTRISGHQAAGIAAAARGCVRAGARRRQGHGVGDRGCRCRSRPHRSDGDHSVVRLS